MTPFPYNVVGRTVAVTGAGSGIGAAIASMFALSGANVVLLGRNENKIKSAIDDIYKRRDRPIPKPKYHQLDVRDPKSWEQVPAEFPNVDVLVNCAGVMQSSLLIKTKQRDCEDILSTNLAGAITGCRVFGKSLSSAGKGLHDPRKTACIINVSSLLAVKASVGTSVYAASKAGLIGLTTSLAQEYGLLGVRVNAILPGYITTQALEVKGIPLPQNYNRIPLKRWGTVEEVAHAAMFLATNPYANGCILNLDGGLGAV
ncbi:hypothetical protein B0H66DRAFT_314778 [Apodospora peruviana]|uniref:Ketoreductase domain-containing protein n=1 Tax=Apodospora peruviana TaxID=516989 RepID=A0AAE0HX67_9PEZI|nr:hypothetical protein B0H66DRAFT_314778 [Apodospora peruviana]